AARPDGCWEMLCQTRGHLAVGEFILVEEGPLRLELVGRRNGHWFARPTEPGSAVKLLGRFGHVPLPPYIRKGRDPAPDRERYQTVQARAAGSAAAPAAGLHFTPRGLERLTERGIERAFVPLHVGLGTFQPIEVEDVSQHRMHREWGELPATVVAAIDACRAR